MCFFGVCEREWGKGLRLWLCAGCVAVVLLVSLRFSREGEEAQRRRSTMNLITTGKNFCVLFMSPLPSANSQKLALPYFFFFCLHLATGTRPWLWLLMSHVKLLLLFQFLSVSSREHPMDLMTFNSMRQLLGNSFDLDDQALSQAASHPS